MNTPSSSVYDGAKSSTDRSSHSPSSTVASNASTPSSRPRAANRGSSAVSSGKVVGYQTIDDDDDCQIVDVITPAKSTSKPPSPKDSPTIKIANASEKTSSCSKNCPETNVASSGPPKYTGFASKTAAPSTSATTNIATSKVPEKEMSPVALPLSLKTEENDVEMAEVNNGPPPAVALLSDTAGANVATVTTGVENASISDTVVEMSEPSINQSTKADEKAEVAEIPVAQTLATVNPINETKASSSDANNQESMPSASRPSDDQKQSTAANSNERVRNGDGEGGNEDEEDPDDEDVDEGDAESEEEVEPQDEDGIPLASIERLTADELKSFKVVKDLLKEYKERLRIINETVIPLNISDKEWKDFEKKRKRFEKGQDECVDVICKICKLDEKDYDREEWDFKFKGCGNRQLDKLITAYVLKMIRPRFGGSLDETKLKYEHDTMLGDFSELRLDMIKTILTLFAKKHFNAKTVPHRENGRPIRADDLYRMIMEDIKGFHALVFNRTVIPKYTLGKTDGKSLHNPELPKDPELLEKLKRNAKTNLHAATLELAQKFEDRKREQGYEVARKGPNDRGPPPSHSDDELTDGDYTDAGSDDEDSDVDMEDDGQPISSGRPSEPAGQAEQGKSPERIDAAAGLKRKDPSTPKDPEGPMPKKKDGDAVSDESGDKLQVDDVKKSEESPAEERIGGGEFCEEGLAADRSANMVDLLPVDASEFKGEETDDEDDEETNDDDILAALLTESYD